MKEALDALSKNYTCDLVTLSPEKSVVGYKWIYRIKTLSNGSIECYKTYLVVKGFTPGKLVGNLVNLTVTSPHIFYAVHQVS